MKRASLQVNWEKCFSRISANCSAVFCLRSLVVMVCLSENVPSSAISKLSLIRLICRGRVALRVLCLGSWSAVSGSVLLPVLPRMGKTYFLNVETGAGVKNKSNSAPACVISGRLIYPSSPSGQRSDFTNPKTCSCSSMSFSMIHQSQPFKK